jgi:hypothetical protein
MELSLACGKIFLKVLYGAHGVAQHQLDLLVRTHGIATGEQKNTP